MTANLPAERAKAKLARKAMDDLRKLGAANRAAAIACFLHETRSEGRMQR